MLKSYCKVELERPQEVKRSDFGKWFKDWSCHKKKEILDTEKNRRNRSEEHSKTFGII